MIRSGRGDGGIDRRLETSGDIESDSGVAGVKSAVSDAGATELCNSAAAAVGQSRPDSKRRDISTDRTPAMRSTYHQLEARLERVEQQLAELNSLPSTKDLMLSGGGQESNSSSSSRPVADMWQTMQLGRKVDANTQGVSKVRALQSFANGRL